MRLLLSALVLAGLTGRARMGLSGAPRHRGPGGRDPRPGAQGGIRSAVGRGPRWPRNAPVRAGSRSAARASTPECIDWAALSGIGGDHSCSSAQMLDTVDNTDWILKVAAIAAQLKVDLSRISDHALGARQGTREHHRRFPPPARGRGREGAAHQRAAHRRHAACRRADPATRRRAGSNNAHFLLARPRTDFTVDEYVAATLRPGSPRPMPSASSPGIT